MLTIRKRGSSKRARERRSVALTNSAVPMNLYAIGAEIGPVVYFIRTKDDLIKIGHTGNISDRKRYFGSGWTHILALVPGTRDDEHDMHLMFKPHLARGREYFHPHPDLIEYINEVRAALGVSAVPATQ